MAESRQARIRAPPRIKKRTTPADNPVILDKWKALLKQYVVEEGLPVWVAYQQIGDRYLTSQATVYRWLNENVRREYYERNKNRPRPDRKTERYRLRNRTRMFFYRNLDSYLNDIFAEDKNLDLDEITLQLRDRLVEQGRPGVLIRNKTLLKLSGKLLEERKDRPGDYMLRKDF